MIEVLVWLALVELIGLLAWPLAFTLFPNLRDRGFAFAKPLGLLLLSLPLWLLGSLHLVPTTRLTISIAVLALGAVSFWLFQSKRGELREFVAREKRTLRVLEVLFLLVFFLWIGYRALDPDIGHTEQPMDFAFLNAASRAVYYPPEDPWLSGHGISYYYLGYLMMGLLTKLSGIPTPITYNLSLALISALAALGVAGLVYTLVMRLGGSRGSGLAYGSLAAVFLLLVSNLEGFLELLRALGLGARGFWEWVAIDGLTSPQGQASFVPRESWWWWRATRVINTFQGGRGLDYTIEEFPFFSFLLGDLHPHVMSLPFTLMSAGLAANLFLSPGPLTWAWLRRNRGSVVIAGLALGALGFLNAVDLFTFGVLFLGAAAFKAWRDSVLVGERRAFLGLLLLCVLLLFLVLVPFLPFYLGLSTQVSGILPVKGPVTRPFHLLLVWGLMLAALLPLLIAMAARFVSKPVVSLMWVSLTLSFLPFALWVLTVPLWGDMGQIWPRFLHILPLALAASLLLYGALQSREEVHAFILGMAFLGLMTVMGPELFYLVDSFNTRMNTVFKLYYQAWTLLAVAGAAGIYWWYSRSRALPLAGRLVAGGWRGVVFLLLAVSLYYPLAASHSKTNGYKASLSLDGLAYLKRASPYEWQAIDWLRENMGRDRGILEAVGDDYTAYGLTSASTGIPTVLQWPGHELQWRGGSQIFGGRAEEVRAVYETEDLEVARRVLSRYDIQYVIVGPKERSKYPRISEARLSQLMEPAVVYGTVTIYRVKE
ncbi:MAG: hypothetical protein HYU29_09195 [Chloroflexi bacterium]|nr:hypothetical protein [Chloroflexota bacterium]